MPKILLNKSNVDLDYPICRPSLDLDFTQEVLDERITFSRGSIGTRVNRNRLIETVAANQPRFDYDPVTGECKGLLIEESRTNLVTYSEQFDNAAWTVGLIRTGITTNTSETTAPDGTNSAEKLREDTTANNTHYIARTFSGLTSTTSYTFSVFAKKAERSVIVIGSWDGVSGLDTTFDINSGTITFTPVGVTASITQYPNGWYRCVTTRTIAQTTVQPVIYLVQGGTGTYTGDGTSGVYIWGAQLEQGSFPTSYIPTVASTVTRSADIAEMTGTNFSSWFNQTEGTLYASINNITTRSSLTFDRFVVLSGTDVNRDGISIFTQTASGGGAQNKFLPSIAYSPDGNYVVNPSISFVGGPDRIGRAIISYKQDNFAFTVNGLTPSRGISGNLPICNRLLIFRPARFQPAPSGTISRLTYYPRALKPNQLQLLTQ